MPADLRSTLSSFYARTATAALTLSLCLGCTKESITADMSRADAAKWGEKVIDCSVPGIGIETPRFMIKSDVTADGKRDVIVSLECMTGNSSSFSHVTVLDGASPADKPKILGTLVRMPKTQDYRQALKTGAKARKIKVKGNMITVVADQWRYMDSTACPSRKYVQIFTVEEGKISAQKASHLDVENCW
ncbi:hypothetical protein [Streptomyces sp. 8P21H-1]|uniref:hypothetical protein n=1 Tax=Streptomyces sp. 8P21H-1 TaxID=2737048 RepID=UPI001C2CD106|nr:hypothetical protein [Streptomyces sp. 8P21H-1]NSL43895.1 hypothetical protein [Streptomyces sp. 8P21H-1]